MNIADLIKHRLETLDHEQRELAAAAGVTESYISQLLNGRKALPAPNRSDIYEKFEAFLKLSRGALSNLADLQRREKLMTKIAEPAAPLYREVRELILQKCKPGKAKQLRPIFEREPFGEIERLVTQKLLDMAKSVAKEQWKDENWLRNVARFNHKSYESMRVIVLEFLETDIFNLSVPNFLYFLEPLVKSWEIDLVTFNIRIVLVTELGRERIKRFELVEKEPDPDAQEELGLREFLQDTAMSRDITLEELSFLKQLRFGFKGKRPTPVYYYRVLQNLRDPLHFQITGSG